MAGLRRALAALGCLAATARGNSFTPPLQLHPCRPAAYSQRFHLAPNGSVYSPSFSKSGIGYCLNIVGNGTREGTQVIAEDCGPQARAESAEPPLPLGAPTPRTGSCAVGPVTCYKDHVPGPKGPYQNLLNISAVVPAGAKLTLEFCAQLCHDYNASLAAAMYSTQCFCGNAFTMPPTKAPDDDCNMPCPGCSVKGACKAEGGKEMCGGNFRSSVFRVDCTGPPVPPPTPAPPPPPPQPPPPPPPCSGLKTQPDCYKAGVRCEWKGGACIDRPPPPPGANQLWQVRGSTLASLQPDTPLCFGIPPGQKGGWNGSDSNQRGELMNCSAPG